MYLLLDADGVRSNRTTNQTRVPAQVIDSIPPGPELLVSEGESIKLNQPSISNPNMGEFGQGDAEIVLQDPLCNIPPYQNKNNNLISTEKQSN